MVPLNLPSFEYRIKKSGGKVWIFDGIRKKYVVLAPEEWVRQHFINYLIYYKNYPRSLVKVETGVKYNALAKRSDVVVFDRKGKPWMVIECKAATVKLGENSARQISVYNKTLNAKYLVLTNGLMHLCYDMSNLEKAVTELPEFSD